MRIHRVDAQFIRDARADRVAAQTPSFAVHWRFTVRAGASRLESEVMGLRAQCALCAIFLATFFRAASAQTTTPPPPTDSALIDADRPGLADTSTVIAARGIQLETGLQWESRSGETSLYFPTLFRIGLSDRLEARVEGNTFTTVHADGSRQSGLAPLSFGAKYVLRNSTDRTPSLGVIGRVFPAWGAGGFQSGRITGDIRLAADWDFAAHLSLNPNVGVGWYEANGRVFVASLAALTLTYGPRPTVAFFVDTGIQAPEAEGGLTSVIVDGGIAYVVGQNLQLDISAGTRVHGDTPARPFIGVGIAFLKRR